MDAAIKQNDDPNRFLWYFIYLMISFVSALPLFGLRLNDFGINYLFLLFIHEFSSFLFFGHVKLTSFYVGFNYRQPPLTTRVDLYNRFKCLA